MREIKYRYVFRSTFDGGWGKELRVNTYTLDEIERGNIPLRSNPDNWELLGRDEYTGLKDCKGREIYEGDIFKAQVNWLSKETDGIEEQDTFIGQILFCCFEWVFNGIVFAKDGEKINTIQLPFSEYRTGYSWGNGIEKWHSTFTSKERFTEFEVIGNIYENPELVGRVGNRRH